MAPRKRKTTEEQADPQAQQTSKRVTRSMARQPDGKSSELAQPPNKEKENPKAKGKGKGKASARVEQESVEKVEEGGDGAEATTEDSTVAHGGSHNKTISDTPYSGSSAGVSTSSAVGSAEGSFSSTNSDIPAVMTPFRTDASALGSYPSSTVTGSGKRRFSETPVPSTNKEHSQITYRDRAAERRNLYGSSSSAVDDLPDNELRNSNRDLASKKFSSDPMPFPPGVGGARGVVSNDDQSFEVITAEKAIDENNVGNRMLRSMGWHEGLGLGKDGSGMIEPVQAQAMDNRAGLGSQTKKLDPSLEIQAGDSYKTVIHKKALARFREMS